MKLQTQLTQIITLLATGALLLACGDESSGGLNPGSDPNGSLNSIESAISNPTGTVSADTMPSLQAEQHNQAQGNAAIQSTMGSYGSSGTSSSVATSSGSESSEADVLDPAAKGDMMSEAMGMNCAEFADSSGDSIAMSYDFDCMNSEDVSGSMTMTMSGMSQDSETQTISMKLNSMCTLEGCVDGGIAMRMTGMMGAGGSSSMDHDMADHEMGASEPVTMSEGMPEEMPAENMESQAPTSTGSTATMTTAVNATVTLPDGEEFRVRYGMRMSMSDIFGSVEIVFYDENGDTYIFTASATEEGGSWTIRGANGTYTCTFSEEGQSGDCDGPDGVFNWGA